MLTFKADNPAFSYAELGDDGNVVRTVEKEVVSHHAICGAYMFSSPSHFLECFEHYKDNCQYDELFMSGLYNEGVKLGGKYKVFECDFHVPFGTPDQYSAALKREEIQGWS